MYVVVGRRCRERCVCGMKVENFYRIIGSRAFSWGGMVVQVAGGRGGV